MNCANWDEWHSYAGDTRGVSDAGSVNVPCLVRDAGRIIAP
jgi:hypothetical protein